MPIFFAECSCSQLLNGHVKGHLTLHSQCRLSNQSQEINYLRTVDLISAGFAVLRSILVFLKAC